MLKILFKAKENRPSTLLSQEMTRVVYPGNSSYSVETGGKLKNLREITMQDVRNYHQKYYRPENFQLTITGQIIPHEPFEALDRIETKIVKKRLPPPDGSGPPSVYFIGPGGSGRGNIVGDESFKLDDN